MVTLPKLGAYVRAARFLPDGRRFATLTTDSVVRIWDITTLQVVREFRLLANSTNLSFNSDRIRMLTTTPDSIYVWNVDTGELLATYGGEVSRIFRAEYSPDGRYMFSSGVDWIVHIRDGATGAILRTFEMGDHRPGIIHLSADNRSMVTAGQDSTVIIWKLGELSSVAVTGEASSSVGLTCFPNPASQSLTIRVAVPTAGDYSVTLYHVDGSVAMEPFNGFASTGLLEIPVAIGSLSSGSYRCVVESAYQTVSRPVIVSR